MVNMSFGCSSMVQDAVSLMLGEQSALVLANDWDCCMGGTEGTIGLVNHNCALALVMHTFSPFSVADIYLFCFSVVPFALRAKS